MPEDLGEGPEEDRPDGESKDPQRHAELHHGGAHPELRRRDGGGWREDAGPEGHR